MMIQLHWYDKTLGIDHIQCDWFMLVFVMTITDGENRKSTPHLHTCPIDISPRTMKTHLLHNSSGLKAFNKLIGLDICIGVIPCNALLPLWPRINVFWEVWDTWFKGSLKAFSVSVKTVSQNYDAMQEDLHVEWEWNRTECRVSVARYCSLLEFTFHPFKPS